MNNILIGGAFMAVAAIAMCLCFILIVALIWRIRESNKIINKNK